MNNHSVRGKPSGTGNHSGHPSDRGDKRQRILESALRVFASKGFFGAKVSDVAEEAGVADGTIYLYFKSKDDLLISLFEEQMSLVNAELGRAVAAESDPGEKLRRFIRAYLELVEKNPRAAEVLTIELRQSAKFMKQYSNPRFAEFLKLLGSVIDEGQKRGRFRPEIPPPVAARALFGMLDELALVWVSRKDKLDIRKASEWVCGLVLEGLERRQS